MNKRESPNEYLANAEASIITILRNISALEKVVDVLLNHWGEDEANARRGVQFVCDYQVKKLGSDAARQSAWREWAHTLQQRSRSKRHGSIAS